jgi:hypothetical protein
VGQDKQCGYKIGVSWQRAQSNPWTRPGWTYSRDAAGDSRSSMYKMYLDYDVVIHLERRGKDQDTVHCLYDSYVNFCMIDLFIFSAV